MQRLQQFFEQESRQPSITYANDVHTVFRSLKSDYFAIFMCEREVL